MEDVEMQTAKKDDMDQDYASAQTVTKTNIGAKAEDKEVNFVQRLTQFRGRKYSGRYDFKIMLEAFLNNSHNISKQFSRR